MSSGQFILMTVTQGINDLDQPFLFQKDHKIKKNYLPLINADNKLWIDWLIWIVT